jgi:probable HAF family extracellular repeat protein
MVPLGTLGGRHSYAYDINNLGQVVGEAATAEGDGNQQGHCFLWSESTGILDLGTLGGPNSVAYGINDDGSIVGDADVAFNTPHPFLYDGLTMRDLNTLIDPSSGWLLGHARAINNVGQIVVDGSITSEPWRHALLLTPVPEAAGTLLAVCTLAIAVSRRPS